MPRPARTSVATFDPTADLDPDTRYTAALTGGTGAVRDLAGNPLTTRSWSFTTGPAPTVTATNPASKATGASRTASIVAEFSEPVAGASGTTAKRRRRPARRWRRRSATTGPAGRSRSTRRRSWRRVPSTRSR